MVLPGMSSMIVLMLGFWTPDFSVTACIRVRVVNKSQAPPEVVTRAERIAAGIFSAAGINTSWEDCPAPQNQLVACPEQADGPMDILVTINREANPRSSPNALGISLPLTGDGNRAGLFYSRIEAAAQERILSLDASVAEVLAHAIAHEIGHLLLEWTTHARQGLMRAGWGVVEFHAMRSSKLFFSPGEAATMRRAVANRSRRWEARVGLGAGAKRP